ncbi:MAG: MerR family transcriptional regulator, partial [Sphingopyxis sp.]
MRDLEQKTGVNRETIRVFFRLGLLPDPVRPKRNVADYDDSHVQAIQAVRNLQRNDGLTLPQIKALLQGRESTRRVEAGAFR